MPKQELFDLAVDLIHQTEKAWLIDDGKKQVWVPKSMAELDKNPDGTYTLTAPERFLQSKDLI